MVLNFKKTLSTLLLILMVFCCISSVNIIKANAKTITCPMCSDKHDTGKLSFPNSWVYDMACKLYGGDIISDDTEEVLRFNVNGTKFNGLWKKGEDLYKGFALLGELLLVIYVMYDLFTKSAVDNLTPEHIAKAFMRLAIGILIVANGYTIISGMAAFTTTVFNKIVQTPPGANPLAEYCNYTKMYRADMFEALVDASTMFIPWILMLFAGGVLSVICWMRLLDVVIRVIFAPIGMADIMNDGTRGAGWRYLKKLLSSLLQGAVLIVILKAYGSVLGIVMLMDGLAAWAMPIILSFVLIGLFFKASGLASEIIG